MANSTEVGAAYLEVKPKLDENFSSDLEKQGTKSGETYGTGFSSKMKGAIGAGAVAVGNLLANMVENAMAQVGQFISETIQTGMGFDSAMSQVAATMGTTVDRIGNLTEFAQEMGATTAFSATQAAEALNYMALAGYDAEQSMTALPSVLNLAAAGSIDLARASDMVTDAQSALGLSFEELDGFVDKLAKTASTTNTSVEQLGEGILTVGGTAKVMAGGTTELAQVLGLLADNGIKGAEGGTALRNMILSLTSPTDKAKQTLDALGVAVFDADGNMRSFESIIGDLNSALDGVTDEERINAISSIFNARDMKSVNALLGTSAERWEQVGGAIDGAAGAASAMANTQLDNLQGDVVLFQSALEGLQIELFHGVEPALRSFVSTATGGLGELTSFLPSVMAGFNDFFFGVEAEYDEFGTQIGEHSTGIFSSMSGAFTDIQAIVETVWPTIQTVIVGAVDAISGIFKVVWPVISDVVVTAFDLIAGITETVWPLIDSIITGVIDSINITIRSLQPVADWVRELFAGIKSAMADPVETAKNLIGAAVDAIKGFFNFRIQWPHIPLPHFGISPSGWQIGDLLKGSIPSLSINWYAEGGFVDGATLIGAGERGAEMILPKQGAMMEEFAAAISKKIDEVNGSGGDTFVFNITADSETTLQSLVAQAQRARIAYGRA